MTNKIAVWLVALIALTLLADWLWLGWNLPLRAAVVVFDLVDYLAFWR